MIAMPNEVVLAGNTYELKHHADELVTVHAQLPNWLREQLRHTADAQGRTIRSCIHAALVAYLDDHADETDAAAN